MKRIKTLVRPLGSAVWAVLELGNRKLFEFMQNVGYVLAIVRTQYVESVTGAVYSVTAVMPNTYDQAGYTASGMNWIDIGAVESCAPFGAVRAVTKFVPINGSTQNVLGTPDFGSLDIVAGDIPADPGQVILTAGEVSTAHLSIRAVFPDSETFYFDVLVASAEHTGGTKSGEVKTITYKCPINLRPTRVAAT